MQVGENDAFERIYTGRFRQIAAPFGEFVLYERDRAARDIGLHLTRSNSSGKEIVSPAIAWFQLKGIRSKTLSKADFDASEDIPIQLELRHIHFWYLAPAPTYLAVYVESADTFLVCDVQKYVSKQWGDGILSLKQAHVTFRISKQHVLDKTAFYHIRLEQETDAWADRFKVTYRDWQLLLVHYQLIYRLKTRKERGVVCRFTVRDWISKTRLEYHFSERKKSEGGWEVKWEQWVFMGFASAWKTQFPYLTLLPTSENGDPPDEDEMDELAALFTGQGDVHKLRVSRGEHVYARDEMGEAVDFDCRVHLNKLGQRLADCLMTLIETGQYEVDLNESHWISAAGWHDRGI